MDDYDIFMCNKIYPDAFDIFATELKTVDQIKKNCLFVLDTNALLLPYTTSSKSIEELKKVYAKLIKEKRLYVPGQVAREFARNRPEKIKELFQKLTRKKTEIKRLYQGQYPLLLEIKAYEDAIKQEKEIDELIKEYTKKLDIVIHQVKNWTWNDPVSIVYNKLFSKETIVEIEFDEKSTKEELERRYTHKIPPGFKDENKEDQGIGDLLIWYTILELGRKASSDVIFVSGEEKTDWYYKSEGQTLYPRFELLSEFRQKSDKHSFHIIKLSELLELFGADDNVVEEVKIEEKTFKSMGSINRGRLLHVRPFEIAVHRWLMDMYSSDYDISLNDRGFPDIVMVAADGKKIGVEVKVYRFLKNISIILPEVLNKAYFEINEGRYSAFKIIIVVPEGNSEDIKFQMIDSIQEKYHNSKMNFDIIVGTWSEELGFIPFV